MAAFPNLEAFWQDACHGARMLRRHPGFAAAATLTLALGIGANTTIFSVVNSVLLRPLPFKDPKRLAIIWETRLNNGATISPIFLRGLHRLEGADRVFEQLAAWRFLYFNLSGRDQPERVQGLTVSASFLPLLRAQVQAGRIFSPEEEQVGHDKVAVLSDALWHRRFAPDPILVGQKINLEGEPYTVVGILASNFQIFRVLNRVCRQNPVASQNQQPAGT
jgi:hypothetical protein